MSVVEGIVRLNKKSVSIPSVEKVATMISTAQAGNEDSKEKLLYLYRTCGLPKTKEERIALSAINKYCRNFA